MAYSDIKYGGLLSDWIKDIPPQIEECQFCGHCWYKHQPEPCQLDQMYSSGLRLLPEAVVSKEPTEFMIREMIRLKRLIGNCKAPTLLDYGSGYGRWSRAATVAGFAVTAFEPSTHRSSEPQPPFHLVNKLDDIPLMKFSVVQMEQVLEHVPDPLSTLRSIKKYCDKGSVLRITVPNILRAHEGSNIWKEWPYGGVSTHTMAPFEHLHGFTPTSLDLLLLRAGLRTISPPRLIRYYPLLFVSQIGGKILPRLGKTMRLVTFE